MNFSVSSGPEALGDHRSWQSWQWKKFRSLLHCFWLLAPSRAWAFSCPNKAWLKTGSASCLRMVYVTSRSVSRLAACQAVSTKRAARFARGHPLFALDSQIVEDAWYVDVILVFKRQSNKNNSSTKKNAIAKGCWPNPQSRRSMLSMVCHRKLGPSSSSHADIRLYGTTKPGTITLHCMLFDALLCS